MPEAHLACAKLRSLYTVVGQDGNADMRGNSHAYRHPEIQLIGEQEAREISTKMQSVYRDIKQTLRVPIVNSDYQALAR